MSSTAAQENGMKVDFEMKALTVVSVYALIKALKAFSDNFLFITAFVLFSF